MPTLRLLSYNVRALRDDKAAVARIISAASPDVVCVQEAPRFLRWRSKCAALARTSGMVVVGGGRRAGGNLVLSSLRIDVESVHDVAFTTDPRLHRRGTAIAVLRLGEHRFAVAGTHLDLAPEPRLRHVHELHAAIGQLVPAGVPTVVAGDINDKPGSPSWEALSSARVDAFAAAGHPFTSTARNPHQTIDGVFVDPALTVRSARVVDDPDVAIASDHLPLVVDLEFAG